MATTSLWHIEGRLNDLIEYVENPEKTVPKEDGLSDFINVFYYVENPNKTENGEYVTAINCIKEVALQQMIDTKKRYKKDDKYIAWHGYQSFKPNEVDAKKCHEIGIALAKDMWGDRFQVIVTTHLDKGHLHNHFCFNSVSFVDGKKYNYSKKEQQRLRNTSDYYCNINGLSTIKNQSKSPSRPVWFDEKAGKNTRYNTYREDVKAAIVGSRSLEYMETYLSRKGYVTDFTGEKLKIRLPQYEYFTNLETLDERYTKSWIIQNMGGRARYGNTRATVTFSPYTPTEIKAVYIPLMRTTHIYKLYLYYCYELGILPKNTEYKPTSPYLKEDLRKIDAISAQVNYMYTQKIETIDDLLVDRKIVQNDMDNLIDYRKKLQNQIRRATPEEKLVLRTEKAEVTAEITDYRKRLKLNFAIEERSIKIQDNFDLAFKNEEKETEKTKNSKDNKIFIR